MSRLVVLSNRVPTDAVPSGGLVVALHECLSERGGVWIGSSDDHVDRPSDNFHKIGQGDYTRLTFDLTREEHEGFYLGYANSVLWPLFHGRSDLIEVSDEYAEAYQRVNRRVARILARDVRPDDVIWVHDYHFLPLAHALREEGVRNSIGFFLHTPFPNAHDLLALPERKTFPKWLAAFDLVGLQAERDVAALLELFRGMPDAELLRNGAIKSGKRRFRVLSIPIGIDVDDFVQLAEASDGSDTLGLADEKFIIGADRLDYSKGLPNRFQAFAEYLDRHAHDAPRTTFLQIAQPSRGDIEAYREIREDLERATGRINGKYGTLEWTPIRYINQSVPRERLAGLFRRADVGLVTPLADGMNLVAKEFVAAQRSEDPGVLVLSRFAGAAEQLTDALLVNPYDTKEVADAIFQAITMPRAERVARQDQMMDILRSRDIAWWTRTFLDHLAQELVAA